jgi:site-specific recombinase XerD
MNVTFKVIIREDYIRKNGLCRICLSVTINRKTVRYQLNQNGQKVYVCLNSFDKEKEKVRKSDVLHFQKNMQIQNAITRMGEIVYQCTMEGKNITHNEIKKHWQRSDSKDFYRYMNELISTLTDSLAPDTLRKYQSMISKLQKFKTNLIFSEIDHGLIDDYKKWMVKQGNSENTIKATFGNLKAVLSHAVKAGYLYKNPFIDYKIGSMTSSRKSLTIDELSKLLQLYQSRETVGATANTLKIFLFCCLTGLRYRDVVLLKWSNIKNGFIEISQHKTKEAVIIPLVPIVLEMLPARPEANNLPVFHVYTNQVINRYLKDIAELTKIETNLTFHVSRHTLATFLLNINTPMAVIQNILGHTQMKTTAIYAHMNPETLSAEMEKLNKSIQKSMHN